MVYGWEGDIQLSLVQGDGTLTYNNSAPATMSVNFTEHLVEIGISLPVSRSWANGLGQPGNANATALVELVMKPLFNSNAELRSLICQNGVRCSELFQTTGFEHLIRANNLTTTDIQIPIINSLTRFQLMQLKNSMAQLVMTGGTS